MPTLRYGRIPSPLGPIWLAETDAGVAACSHEASPGPMLDALRHRFPQLTPEPAGVDGSWLHGGHPPHLDLTGLSRFDAQVYRAVAAIPPGETMTYGEVARCVGAPGAARAVGGAMARCPLFPAVPCHRVVRASDGWSGWGGDVALKRRMLAAELAPRRGTTTSSTCRPGLPRRRSGPRRPPGAPSR